MKTLLIALDLLSLRLAALDEFHVFPLPTSNI